MYVIGLEDCVEICLGDVYVLVLFEVCMDVVLVVNMLYFWEDLCMLLEELVWVLCFGVWLCLVFGDVVFMCILFFVVYGFYLYVLVEVELVLCSVGLWVCGWCSY